MAINKDAAAILTIVSALFAGAWAYMRWHDANYTPTKTTEAVHMMMDINALELESLDENGLNAEQIERLEELKHDLKQRVGLE